MQEKEMFCFRFNCFHWEVVSCSTVGTAYVDHARFHLKPSINAQLRFTLQDFIAICKAKPYYRYVNLFSFHTRHPITVRSGGNI